MFSGFRPLCARLCSPAILLLATVVLLFGFQAQTIIDKPLAIGMIALPLLVRSCGIFAIAHGRAYLRRVPFTTAAPAALVGTSNFFDPAVAVAFSLFGLHSGAHRLRGHPQKFRFRNKVHPMLPGNLEETHPRSCAFRGFLRVRLMR